MEMRAGISAADALMESLRCPVDGSRMHWSADHVICQQGHGYPVVEGIPVLLLKDVPDTHKVCTESMSIESLRRVRRQADSPPPGNGVDPFVQKIIVGTHGPMYRRAQGRMDHYPIPELPLPPGEGRTFLEVGCNWGRWCFAAARAGYNAIGIDPSLDGVDAARRIALQLGLEDRVRFVVGDARFMPFADDTFDVVFSYSVLQHFSKADVRTSLRSVKRVLRPGGKSLIQMPNQRSLRALYRRVRPIRDQGIFRVRDWSPGELHSTFSDAIGPTELSIDGFFSLNAQPTDIDLLPWRFRTLVRASTALKRVGRRVPSLKQVADSLYLQSTKTLASDPPPD